MKEPRIVVERGTGTLDLGIMSAEKIGSVFSTTYRVASVAIGTTEHNKAARRHAKLTQNSMFPRREAQN
jgi:hypothetical protein